MPLSYLAHSRALVINFDPRGANSSIYIFLLSDPQYKMRIAPEVRI